MECSPDATGILSQIADYIAERKVFLSALGPRCKDRGRRSWFADPVDNDDLPETARNATISGSKPTIKIKTFNAP